MATGQTLLDRLEAIDDDLDLQSGETDVTHGLIWLNAAQDYFESIVSMHRNVLGSDKQDVTTSADVETNTFPSGLLRVDRLQFIDPDDSLPEWDIEIVYDVGGHLFDVHTLHAQYNVSGTGRPRRAFINGTDIFWGPVPDDSHTVRVYGFSAASDITAGGTFAYPDVVIQPIVEFAGWMAQRKIDDPEQNYQAAAETVFTPVIRTLSNFNRAGFRTPRYTRAHSA